MGLFPELKKDSMLADLRTKLREIISDRNRQFQDAWQKVKADLVKTPDGRQFAEFIDSIIAKIQNAFRDPERQFEQLSRGVGDWYKNTANATAKQLFTVSNFNFLMATLFTQMK